MQNITISILIPIHNRLKTTQEGLTSLFKAINYYKDEGLQSIDFNVIVIDDGSTDGSSDWISLNFPKVKLLNGDGNLWWTGAINLGAKFAVENIIPDYILLWNDDISPDVNYFVIAEEILSNYDRNTVLGSKILDIHEQNIILSFGGKFNKFTGIETIINSKYLTKYSNSGNLKVDSLTGMGTFLPIQIIKAIGYWDYKLPHYKSDSDFILTAKAKGYNIIACNNLIIYDDSKKRGISSPQTFLEFYKNLKSIKSPYNIQYLLRYRYKHGYVPFVFIGIFVEIFPIFLGLLKRRIFAIRLNEIKL